MKKNRQLIVVLLTILIIVLVFLIFLYFFKQRNMNSKGYTKIKENNDKTTILHIRNYHKTGGKKRPTTTEQYHDRTIDGSDMAAWQHGIATYDTTPTTALRGWRGGRGGRSRGCMRF